MALRTPIYLDTDTLFAEADYHEIDVPQREEIVEKTTRRRSGGGKLKLGVGAAAAGVDASRGSDVERQSTYSLDPSLKAKVSRVIDTLIADGAVRTRPGADGVLARDDLVEVEGITRITAASHFGKLFFILRRVLEDANLEDLGNLPATLSGTDPRLQEQMKRVYLHNELPPVPVLLELERSGLPCKVYVNVDPNHFIDDASADRVEGGLRVLGTVSRIIDGSPDGYLSAEEWLLSGWEYMFRRTVMTQVDDVLAELRRAWADVGIALPSGDVNAYISGPAVVVNAIALY
ncbi:hypothetical protein OHS33_37345 (plasmid) [Streptomyces sp. NBC_00536]|uniref:DUF6414 family protein n=1 Tax=Streptomyces sp. NBC_00536 TaxID=2975769 RepID=UPI002E80EE39|nr:hypothetical protein [Streptomyces sp. NBC_00536]WUC76883.1 hypothetical protein OHS33_00035 [Streptomyces sp. NBC_00536]WUC83514.1 hypothetical protein OHS33_37280 [Streptomyces sp. NBC_00536]WUC84074.1 hypothetical protein OHS33_37345 [Streptomyces sp. NBC_00536]